MANAEYQKVVPIIMNLATASLAVPVLLAKGFTPGPGQPTPPFPFYWAVPGWVLLAFSLFCGCIFHIASAKLVKALYGGYDDKTDADTNVFARVLMKPLSGANWTTSTWQESSYERLRDVSIGVLVASFVLGLICLVGFLVAFF